MTQPAVHDNSLETILSREFADLHAEVDSFLRAPPSDDGLASVRRRSAELRSVVAAVAAVLENPGPETVSKYLRYVASGTAVSRSRRFTASSLRLLQAALGRSARV